MENNHNDKNLTGASPEESVSDDSQKRENQSAAPAEESQLTENQNVGQMDISLQEENRSPGQEKEKEAHKPSKGRKRLWIAAAAIVLILAAVGASLASCSKSRRISPQARAEPEFRYAMLEASWNHYANEYPANFKLSGERGGSDTNMIKALNNWLSAFSSQPGSKYAEELERLRNVYGVTAFHAWEDFRREHHRQNELMLNAQMNPAALCEMINNYIGIARPQNPQDYISADTVKTIVYMNSICAFFEGEQYELHKEGIDTEIKDMKFYDCKKLDPGDKFPVLQELLNN